jgi:hypothetical protein
VHFPFPLQGQYQRAKKTPSAARTGRFLLRRLPRTLDALANSLDHIGYDDPGSTVPLVTAMKALLVLVYIMMAASSGGNAAAKSASADWPNKWCDAKPGMTKDQIVGLMGAPTTATATSLAWSDNHFRFYAFMDSDGTAKQLDINQADLTAMEKQGLKCKAVRTRHSVAAESSKPAPRNIPACMLVTDTEMSTILGAPVRGNATSRSKCTYKTTTGSTPYVEFSMDYGDGEAGMAGAGFAGKHEPGLTSPYDGIGDQAVAAGPALFIKSGDDLITLVFSGVADVPATAKKIVDAVRAKN